MSKKAVKAWVDPPVWSALKQWAAAMPGMTVSKLVERAVRRELARLQAQQRPLDVTNTDKLEGWTEEEADPRVRAVSRSLRTATSDGGGNVPRRGLRKAGRRPDDA